MGYEIYTQIACVAGLCGSLGRADHLLHHDPLLFRDVVQLVELPRHFVEFTAVKLDDL